MTRLTRTRLLLLVDVAMLAVAGGLLWHAAGWEVMLSILILSGFIRVWRGGDTPDNNTCADCSLRPALFCDKCIGQHHPADVLDEREAGALPRHRVRARRRWDR